eukprot:TRINITY_DN39442_c0_g1_i1.p1 TRINITY_DN39442_c0_g1~~TRINITY_DN39442_c0_g1_i1.p1  ORF type:complete len:231 (+),score=19.58 TRINITY_DN39442_c0_g1_i1:87-779(+)
MGIGNSQSPVSLGTRLPTHGGLYAFFWREKLVNLKQRHARWSISVSSPDTYCNFKHVEELGLERFNRIEAVERVYWCTEPLNEAGPFKEFSPRTLPRVLGARFQRGLSGPSSWEVGHSYGLVRVRLHPWACEAGGQQSRLYRLNWGRGIQHGTNLTMFEQDHVPQSKVTGERLEQDWQGTCTGEELYDLMAEWDGRVYDVSPSNNANCHHFIQDLIDRCTHARGFDENDR